MLRRRALALALAVAGLSAGTAASPAAALRPRAPAAAAKTCRGSVRGIIGGQVKCLRRGEYCATRYRAQYVRYGFHCSGSPARLR